MQNRFYDANTGRFIQRDPISFAGGLNLYVYAGNNPINAIDPSGTLPDIVGLVSLLGNFGSGRTELDQMQQRIQQEGPLRAAENGDFQAESQRRGRVTEDLGRQGAQVALRSIVNEVPGQPSILSLSPGAVTWTAAKSRLSDVPPLEDNATAPPVPAEPQTSEAVPAVESPKHNPWDVTDEDWAKLK